ncbi:MAG: LssY C-terminal domain-containing protein [Roseiarcus sp.]|jgi:hypothetical protein
MTALDQPAPPRRRARSRRLAIALLGCLAVYLALAYLVSPFVWRHFDHQRAIAGLAMTTVTRLGIPGDALNVGLEGSQDEVVCAIQAAGWSPADPVTLKTSLKIVGSVLLDRAYAQAPVSDLFYEGRREDLAFEKPSGKSPDTRHHVRLWKAVESGDTGRPVWLGAATFDRGVGVSRYTAQITHHISSDIDAERDLMLADLTRAGKVAEAYETSGIGPTLSARNGGGDVYFTDGEIRFALLAEGCAGRVAEPVVLVNPPATHLKNRLWRWARGLIGRE